MHEVHFPTHKIAVQFRDKYRHFHEQERLKKSLFNRQLTQFILFVLGLCPQTIKARVRAHSSPLCDFPFPCSAVKYTEYLYTNMKPPCVTL